MHGAADFLFVLNGDISEAINASLPEHLPNVRVIRRENTCFDLGSYGVVLSQLETEGRLAQYTAIILMNASIIGPVVPTYVQECWTRIFTNRLSESVGLVGTTLNCLGLNGPAPHVQSMLLTFSPAALAAVRPALECYQTKEEAISRAEVTFSQYRAFGGAPGQRFGRSRHITHHRAPSVRLERHLLAGRVSRGRSEPV